ENQPFEAHESTVKTPLKQTATSNQLLAEIQPAAFGHLTTPPKPNDISPGDPWTPTANLKMLISAASPEIRNREQEKRLTDSRSEIPEAKHFVVDHFSGDDYEKSQPSRKEKSLGLLCHKFLARYPSYPSTSKNNEICLDEVAEELNVERRRIYDIMNVLESLHMVSRLAKNKYSWHGRHNLKTTLQLLKKVAEENKYMQQLELIKKRESEQEPVDDGEKMKLMSEHVGLNLHNDISFVELPGMEFRAASVNSRKDKSLRVMSQKFVMLFLVSTSQVVSLEVAAKILIGEDHVEYLDKSKFKTKIRRLYDIANVLSSLELIEKVHVTEEKGRKPAFKWTGPAVFSDIQGPQPILTAAMVGASRPVEGKFSKENCSKNLFHARNKQGFTRHSSLIKVAKSMRSDWRKIRSAPSSPIKKNTSHIPLSCPNKMAQLAAICKQQLDEQSRKIKNRNVKLDIPCASALPLEPCLKARPFLLPSQAEMLPLMTSSMSPAAVSPIHSSMPYAVYLHPSQTQIVTACNPGLAIQPVPSASAIRKASPVAARSQAVPAQVLTEDDGSRLERNDATAQDQNLCLAKEQQEGTKDALVPEKCFKRCNALLEESPTKKCKSEEVELQDVLLVSSIKLCTSEPRVVWWLRGEHVMSKKAQSSLTFHLGQEDLTSPTRQQSEKMDQHLEYQPEQQKQEDVLKYDKIAIAQGIPAAFVAHKLKTWFPSAFLIPLPQCTRFVSGTTLSNQEKAEVPPAEQESCGSSVVGGIPATSDLTAVNVPALHIAPLSLMLPPSAVAALPVLDSTALASAHASPVQVPDSSMLNFTLQHLGLIPTSIKVSADQGLGPALIFPGAECVTSVPRSEGLKQGKTLQNILPARSHDCSGKTVPTAPLQQVRELF
ncbi:Transcription factor E2F8, partial [Varanus komodoensis]